MLCMTDSRVTRSVDQEIGERVKNERGPVAQTALASKMKQLGHKWSQATVWAVEKGERALKLSEAKDLASLLGVSVTDLLEDESEAFAWIWKEVSAAHRSVDELLEALIQWGAYRQRMHGIDVWLEDPANREQIPESQRETLPEVVYGAASHPSLKEILRAFIEDEARLARVSELDFDNDSPVDVNVGSSDDVILGEWNALTENGEDDGVDTEA